jgi:hypothetical protein
MRNTLGAPATTMALGEKRSGMGWRMRGEEEGSEKGWGENRVSA